MDNNVTLLRGRPAGRDDGWLVDLGGSPSLPALVIIPHAGAGTAAYRPLAHAMREVARPLIVRLPGRETRQAEPPFDDIRPLTRALVPELLPRLGQRFVLYGHSMGALIAFECARALQLAYGATPAHLVVSGSAAPRARTPQTLRYHLPDEALWRSVCELGGVPAEVAAEPGMRQALLPVLRADFHLVDHYTYRPAGLLDCPVSSYAGMEDEEVQPSPSQDWEDETRTYFQYALLPGEHFFNLDPASGFRTSLRLILSNVAKAYELDRMDQAS